MPDESIIILPPHDFEYERVVFTGTQGDVLRFAAARTDDGSAATLFVLAPPRADVRPYERRKKQFLHEVDILLKIPQGHLVRFLGNFEALLDGQPTVGFGVEHLGNSLSSLSALCPDGLPPDQARKLFIECVENLAALHDAGVAVRDLHPEALVFDEGGTLKICAFGTTRTASSSGTLVEHSRLYTAPEVLDGAIRRGFADDPPPQAYFRSDIFSLGLIFYEALVGSSRWKNLAVLRGVFEAIAPAVDTTRRWNDWLTNRDKELPPIGPIRPDIDPHFAALLDRMVAKAPARRPESAAEILAELPANGPAAASTEQTRVGDPGPQHRADGGTPPPAPNSETDAPGAASVPPPGGLLPNGHRLARRYRIGDELGRGGMGVVYKAEDLETGQTVAVKVLFPHCSDVTSVKRFQKEAQAASQLLNPHIVHCLDIGEDLGLHYLVMEFVDGPNVQQRIQKGGAFTEEETRALAIQVLKALSAGHQNGIVHRDVKSPNILIDKDGNAKLTDFGIVRIADATRMTSRGDLLGTPEYMSPEQCQGAHEVGSPTDLYSLGVVMFEMLTGRPPFTAATPTGVALKHFQEAPPDPAALTKGLSKQMVAIVLTALVKDPAKRFASAQQMIEALEGRFKVTKPGTGRLQRSEVRLAPWQKAIIAGVAFMLVCAALAAIVTVKNRQERAAVAERQRMEAELARRQAEQARLIAQQEANEKEQQRIKAEAEANAATKARNAAEEARQRSIEQANEDRATRTREAAATQRRLAEEAQARADAETRQREADARRAEAERQAAEARVAAAREEANRQQVIAADERRRRREAEAEAARRAEEAEEAAAATSRAREAQAAAERAQAEQRAEEEQRQQEAEARRCSVQASMYTGSPYFGAIAYSASTGVSGTAHTAANLYQAQALAVRACGQRDCQAVVWGSSCWLALAVSRRNAGWAWAYSQGDAESGAISNCSR